MIFRNLLFLLLMTLLSCGPESENTQSKQYEKDISIRQAHLFSDCKCILPGNIFDDMIPEFSFTARTQEQNDTKPQKHDCMIHREPPLITYPGICSDMIFLMKNCLSIINVPNRLSAG